MHAADLCSDMNILKLAQDEAQMLLSSDPELSKPEHSLLLQKVDKLFSQNADSFN